VLGTRHEALLVLITSAVTAFCLWAPLVHEERLRLDPLARLTAPTKPALVRLSLASAAPLTLLAVVFLEARGGLGGLGATLTDGDWLSPASLPALTRTAFVLPAVRLALRVLRHAAGDERFSVTGEPHTDGRPMVSDADPE
jgi:hypothetical protein